MRQWKLSRRADQDIVDIITYSVSHFGEQTARGYHRKLQEAFDLIAEHPALGRLRTEIAPPIHAWPVQSHLVFYDVDENEDVIIQRILHQHMDWATILHP